MNEYKLLYYCENSKVPFDSWFSGLEKVSQFRIESRLDRIEVGNFGDYKSLEKDLLELRYILV